MIWYWMLSGGASKAHTAELDLGVHSRKKIGPCSLPYKNVNKFLVLKCSVLFLCSIFSQL